VVSEVGDITDLAIEGVTAKVVQYPYRAKEFAEAIVDMLHHEDERQIMGKNARRIVKSVFSIAAEAKRWNRTLQWMLSGYKGRLAVGIA